jgi:parvulin-like peptidyl-prolyl isomerase
MTSCARLISHWSSLLKVTLFLCLAVASARGEIKKEDVVATVGNRKINLEEFNRRFNDVRTTENAPTRKQFIEELVRFEMGLAEAEKMGLEKDPIFLERVKSELYKTYLEKELGQQAQKIAVSDKEMEDFYKKNPEIRFAHIVIEVKPGATAAQRTEAKKRAEEIWEEVKKSKRPFEELVKLYSDDLVTKSIGGDAGFQSRLTLTPKFYDTLLGMKRGEVRGLIETPFGFHIVKELDRRTYENADKRQIRMGVFNDKRLALFNSHFDKLKKKYPVTVNNKLVE